MKNESTTILQGSNPMSDLFVILDGGHGWNTKGHKSDELDKRGQSVLVENEFTDAMVNKVSYGLFTNGISCGIVSKEWYDTPLWERSFREGELHDIVRDLGQSSIFISFHVDAFNKKQANGRTVFYYSRKAKLLAEHFESYLTKSEGIDSRGIKKANYHVLRETKSLAILIEFGFMTNIDDLKFLTYEFWRNSSAELIVDACKNWRISE